MANHHPELSLLTAYAAGHVPDAQALALAVHVHACAVCQQRLAQLHGLGGTLMQDLPEATISDTLLARTLEQLDTTPPPTARAAAPRDDMAPALRHLLPNGLPQRWTRILPGVKQATLSHRPDGSLIALHHIRAGARVPVHTHEGEEITVVLRGAFSDEQGLYRHGDFLLADTQTEHTPTAARNEDCLCLTIQAAPLKLTGPFGRLFNPLIRALR